jgi:hypothetical protein
LVEVFGVGLCPLSSSAGVIGSFHHISKEHLDRYCDEFSFRWDYRSISDSDRTEIALQQRANA